MDNPLPAPWLNSERRRSSFTFTAKHEHASFTPRAPIVFTSSLQVNTLILNKLITHVFQLRLVWDRCNRAGVSTLCRSTPIHLATGWNEDFWPRKAAGFCLQTRNKFQPQTSASQNTKSCSSQQVKVLRREASVELNGTPLITPASRKHWIIPWKHWRSFILQGQEQSSWRSRCQQLQEVQSQVFFLF